MTTASVISGEFSFTAELQLAKQRGGCIHQGAQNKDACSCAEQASERMLFYHKFQMCNAATYSCFSFWYNAMPSNSLKIKSVNSQLKLILSSFL